MTLNILEDPQVMDLLGHNIDRTQQYFQRGLDALAADPDLPLEELADVVLGEYEPNADWRRMADKYSNAELVVNRTPIRFTRLIPASGFFHFAIYRLVETPQAVGYATYSDETPFLETMNAVQFVEALFGPTDAPLEQRMQEFAVGAPPIVAKVIKVARLGG